MSDDDDAVGAGRFVSGAATPRSISPKPVYPSISLIYSGSFDLDDDDDVDVEADLKRYHLNFSEKANSLTSGDRNQSLPETTSAVYLAANSLWYSFQSVRQQARQRRAQLLLQQTERNWRQSLWICVMTSCDATDLGIIIVAVIMIAWALALIFIKSPIARTRGLFVGIVLFIVRVGTRPILNCFLEQRQKRHQQHQALPQQFPRLKSRRSDVIMDDRHHHPYPTGSLELHDIDDSSGANSSTKILNIVNQTSDDIFQVGVQASKSTGSDPTVAAI